MVFDVERGRVRQTFSSIDGQTRASTGGVVAAMIDQFK
jgi:hypothetical protein